MKIIPYGRQYIDTKDISAVSKTLKNDKITSGNEVQKFEDKINNFLKCKFSITCNSGTSAIFLAMQAINIKKNDVIVMPVINFIASHNIAKLFGAKIFLADVNAQTGQMTPEDFINCCKKFKLKKVKALIVMYNGGYPENADKFIELKKKYGFFIIEDACHALGASYINKKKNIMVGSCRHSDLCTFSFHPLKSITTGEGGIVTTNNRYLYDKVKKLSSLGIKKKKNHWEYDVLFTGLNFRLNDFQCALGISQLKKLKKFLSYRKKIFSEYIKSLKDLKEIQLPSFNSKYKSSNHLFIIQLKNFSLNQKNTFIKYMLKKKIILQYHYIPIYKFKIFKGKYSSKSSKIYFNTSVSLPIYFGLSKQQQQYIVKSIKNYFH